MSKAFSKLSNIPIRILYPIPSKSEKFCKT
jgi:hypothetical protein